MSILLSDHLRTPALSYLCNIHHVSISTTTEQGHQQLIGDQYTIEIYTTANDSLLLQCYPMPPSSPNQDQPSLQEMTISVASQSKAHLMEPSKLIVPHSNGGSWTLDCRDSDLNEFITLQDMLTHFIKFENQQKMRNTLAMIDPSSYKVTQVIAEDVFLNREPTNGKTGDWDGTESISDVEEDDFIASREHYYGQKLPVTMDDNVFQDGLELRKVKLIQKTSQCMDFTSDWVARGLISAGDSIAGYIQSGTRSMEENVETSTNRQLVSSKQRHYFDIVFNLTSIVGNMAGQWISNLFNFKASPEFRMPRPKTQLGNSALQAASRVLEGSHVAAGTVLSASRQTLVQAIERRYGADAGYMAEKIMGSDKEQADVMVYFDGQGVSRKVVMQSPPPVTTHLPPSNSVLVYDSEDNADEKEPEKLILV